MTQHRDQRPLITAGLVFINQTQAPVLSSTLSKAKGSMKLKKIHDSFRASKEQSGSLKPTIIRTDLSPDTTGDDNAGILYVAEAGDCRTMVFRPDQKTFLFDSECPPCEQKQVKSMVPERAAGEPAIIDAFEEIIPIKLSNPVMSMAS